MQKAVKETKLRVEELEKAHEVKLNEVTEEATANKEALEQLERQYNLEVCKLFVNILFIKFC